MGLFLRGVIPPSSHSGETSPPRSGEGTCSEEALCTNVDASVCELDASPWSDEPPLLENDAPPWEVDAPPWEVVASPVAGRGGEEFLLGGESENRS